MLNFCRLVYITSVIILGTYVLYADAQNSLDRLVEKQKSLQEAQKKEQTTPIIQADNPQKMSDKQKEYFYAGYIEGFNDGNYQAWKEIGKIAEEKMRER